MKTKKFSHSLILLTSLAAILTTCKAQTSHRKLSSIGDYNIVNSDEYKKFCTDKGIKDDDINLPEDKHAKFVEKLDKKWPGLHEMMKEYIKTKDSGAFSPGEAASAVAYPLFLNIIVFLLSMVCMLFMPLWCICQACCFRKVSCCMKKRKAGDPESCMVKCTLLATFVAGGLIVFSLFFFFIYSNKAVGAMDYVSCGLSSMHNDIQNGVNNNGLFFAGAGGLKFLQTEFINSLNEIQQEGGGAATQNALNRNMDTKADNLKLKFENFQNAYEAVTIASTFQTASSVLIGEDALRIEIEKIAEAALSSHSGLQTAKDMSETGGDSVKDGLNAAFDSMVGIFEDFATQIGKLRDDMSGLGGDEVKGMARLAVLFIVAVIGGFSIIMFILAFLSGCLNKCVCFASKCGKLFMLIEMMCSVFINFAAIFMIIAAIVMTNICFLINLSFNDKEFVEEALPDLNKFFEPCLYADSTGDMSELLPSADMGDFNKLSDLSSSKFLL